MGRDTGLLVQYCRVQLVLVSLSNPAGKVRLPAPGDAAGPAPPPQFVGQRNCLLVPIEPIEGI